MKLISTLDLAHRPTRDLMSLGRQLLLSDQDFFFFLDSMSYGLLHIVVGLGSYPVGKIDFQNVNIMLCCTSKIDLKMILA